MPSPDGSEIVEMLQGKAAPGTDATPSPPAASGGMFANMKNNPLFAAGAGMAGLGVAMSFAKRGLLTGIQLAQKYGTVSLEIPSKDRSYQWVLQWISRHNRNSQHLGVETTFHQHKSGRVSAMFDFVPSPGQHWISFRRTFIRVIREREKSMIDLNSGTPWETVTLTALGRDKTVFAELLAEAKEMALSKEEGKMVVYTSMGPEWRQFGQPKARRPLSSVVLAEGLGERLKADLEDFGHSGKWYIERGIPYRRGYLLHGPPGCGKTSFIMALAGELQYNICIMNLNERGMTDDKLHVLLSVAPPRSFILLEDIDAAFVKRDAKKEAQHSVTFSGLLNALDGVASTEERIVFMTTNHVDRLDPALIRPGRVDMKEEVGYATVSQMHKMFLRFYPEEYALADEWVMALTGGKVAEESGAAAGSGTGEHEQYAPFAQSSAPRTDGFPRISIAEMQGFFMFFKGNPRKAVDNVGALLKQNRLMHEAVERQQQQERRAAAISQASEDIPNVSRSSSNNSAVAADPMAEFATSHLGTPVGGGGPGSAAKAAAAAAASASGMSAEDRELAAAMAAAREVVGAQDGDEVSVRETVDGPRVRVTPVGR